MHHVDMGYLGSEFTILHPPLNSQTVFMITLIVSLAAAFFCGVHLMDATSLTEVGLLLAAGILWKLWSKIYSEHVLILPSLGLQVQTQNYLGHVSSQFICLSQIKDVVINETVTMNSILIYLVVILHDGDSSGQQMLYPLFVLQLME